MVRSMTDAVCDRVFRKKTPEWVIISHASAIQNLVCKDCLYFHGAVTYWNIVDIKNLISWKD